MQGRHMVDGAWLLTDVEGCLGLHGGCRRSHDAPAEDEQAQPCGRSNLCDDKVTGHLENEVSQGEDACNCHFITLLHLTGCRAACPSTVNFEALMHLKAGRE